MPNPTINNAPTVLPSTRTLPRREYTFSNDEAGQSLKRMVEAINANTNIETRVQQVAALFAMEGAATEIVGVWVWCTFPERPSENVLAALHTLKAHWNRRRSLWQYAGRRAGRSTERNDALRQRYGARRVTAPSTVRLSNTFVSVADAYGVRSGEEE